MTDAWRTQVAPDWRDVLDGTSTTLASLGEYLRAEAAEGRHSLPPSASILRAFEQPLADVRVLIVGQDPYPTPGDAVGLSFAVPPGHPMPRSLVNIATELRHDTGEALTSGDLTHWASQGVLLLNRVLTVSAGLPGSHRGRGLEQVTAVALGALARRGGPLVAVLWGRDSQALEGELADIPIIASAHPSPLSAHRGFFGSRPFSRVNALLAEQGAAPIGWGTPTA